MIDTAFVAFWREVQAACDRAQSGIIVTADIAEILYRDHLAGSL